MKRGKNGVKLVTWDACSELGALNLHLEAIYSSVASLIERNEANNWKCSGFYSGAKGVWGGVYLEAFHISK